MRGVFPGNALKLRNRLTSVFSAARDVQLFGRQDVHHYEGCQSKWVGRAVLCTPS